MQAQTHEKGTADNDKDAARLVAGLGVDSGNLVLNALERKFLCSHMCISLWCPMQQYDVFTPAFRDLATGVGCSLMIPSYLELADDVGGTEERRLLEGEHGVLTLYAVVSLSVSCPAL